MMEDSASEPPGPNHAARINLPPNKTLVSRGKDRRGRENTLTEGEAALLSREKSAATREDAAIAREETAHLREDAAEFREGEIHQREGVLTLRELETRVEESIRSVTADHMALLRQANESLVIATLESHKLVEQIQETNSQLDHLVHHDALTDLPNRILLLDRLSQAIEMARRQGRQLALLFMDLDHFKHINDSLGHAIGDQLLQSVAQRLSACARHSDTLSRQGGDEFLLLLPYIEHPEDAALSAQKLLVSMVPSHIIDLHDLHIGLSVGISIYPDDGDDAETLIKAADTAMYYAKENGRNNYKFFEHSMNVRAVQRQTIEANLRRALERQEFILHYQPKINLESGLMVGVEALVRWQHPERGLLLPAQFIPIAEDCGLILQLGRWVLREACRQAQAWRQVGLPAITMAVNTSAIEFRAEAFLANIRATLEETGWDGHYLELELTETVLMRDAEATDHVLHSLSALGVKLTVDDFGTGYSSLSYLRRFPIGALKIDQSFVEQMTTDPGDASLVSAVINMGKSLQQRVIAEGVETAEQNAFLLAQRCDEGQGFYFGRPIDAAAFGELLSVKGVSSPLN